MHSIRIILLCILAAILYGIVHDLFTAHLCVEYFTVGHKRIIESESPIALALTWGVIATWWMGLILGVPLALCARLGRWPQMVARELIKPIAVLLLAMGVSAIIAAFVGRSLASGGDIRLNPWLAERVPESEHVDFLTAGAAHVASYAVGFFGGITLSVVTLVRRYRRSKRTQAVRSLNG